MPQQIIIAEQLRIAALLTDERVDELIVAQGRYQIGDVYLGTVENVLPGIDAAFVNIGESEKNGFIHVSDLGPLRLKKGSTGITELLEPRQKVLVQVMKEPTGTKGPRLTGNLALPGRYLVLQPNSQGVNISRRVNSEKERNRLRALGVLIKPPGTGLLIRTEAENIEEELLINDLESLLKQWELIQQASETCSPPVLLNRDEDFIHRILRDHVSPNVTRVVVENQSGVERVNQFLSQDGLNVLVECHKEQTDLLEYYKINAAINDALRPRVDLPSGGYIIIEPTEALTVIDVNSGSFTRSANARETVLWTNCEAAIEIARQLKLRNIGGVIIIDFIDMESRRDQLQLLEHFTSAIKDDSSRPQIAQLTELGLVELTRKRQGQNIYELFGKQCSNCNGLGHTTCLPQKSQMEPVATASGLVQSSSSIKAEGEDQYESGNNRKKKPDRLRNNEPSTISTSENLNSTSEILKGSSENISEEQQSEAPNHRQEPEVICVEMDPDQEKVYSSMGFCPTLLIEPTPNNDNVIVHVVRPGEDINEALEDARNQLLINSNKRRKRGRNPSRAINKGELEPQSSIGDDTLIITSKEDNNNEVNIEEESIDSQEIISENDAKESINNENNVEAKILPEEESEIEDPRRKRRRSSASK